MVTLTTTTVVVMVVMMTTTTTTTALPGSRPRIGHTAGSCSRISAGHRHVWTAAVFVGTVTDCSWYSCDLEQMWAKLEQGSGRLRPARASDQIFLGIGTARPV
jgi:hypothetical protein